MAPIQHDADPLSNPPGGLGLAKPDRKKDVSNGRSVEAVDFDVSDQRKRIGLQRAIERYASRSAMQGALKRLGQHLGMFQKNAPGTEENPVVTFIQSMQGTPLPIGHVEPEQAASAATQSDSSRLEPR
jgi:hypothetical protein